MDPAEVRFLRQGSRNLGQAHVVLARAKEEGVELVAVAPRSARSLATAQVLTTHHHYDHAGGNAEMVKQVPGIKVYGGRIDNVAACTDALDHGNKLVIGSIEVTALHTPGHTKGSICYFCCSGKEARHFDGSIGKRPRASSSRATRSSWQAFERFLKAPRAVRLRPHV